jgi:hypothetical protein
MALTEASKLIRILRNQKKPSLCGRLVMKYCYIPEIVHPDVPVRKITEDEYQILFASQFTFKPDSIIKIIHRTIHAAKLPHDYIVNVVECASQETIFGYAILEAEMTNIIPCRGRQQSKGCYLINISFKNTGLLGLPKSLLLQE